MLAFSGNAPIDQQQQQNNSSQQSNVQQQNQIQGQMRLREEVSSINPVTRNTRKRKSPSSNNPTDQPPQLPPPPPQQMLHHLPPPHAMIHSMQGGPMPPHYPYADYTPGGMPPNPPQPSQDPSQQSPTSAASGRALSSSKRAEQNRKAQRAFRERRDQLVLTYQISFPFLVQYLMSRSDMSKHSNRVPSSWTLPSHLLMRPIDAGKSVVLWSINCAWRMLLSELLSARLRCCHPLSPFLQPPHLQVTTALASMLLPLTVRMTRHQRIKGVLES